jgi:SEC-C motif
MSARMAKKEKKRGRNKIGRNDPCPCRSGKKYKHCHLDRSRQEPLSLEVVRKEWERTHGRRLCLHPDAGPSVCSGKIVRAHTLRRSADLERIARSGHVYGIKPLPFTPPERWVKPRLVGIKEASTFTGFCALHDNHLFRPLEECSFEATPEQVALLSYRTLCRELFAKRAAMEFVPTMREGDRGAPAEFQEMVQANLNRYETGNSAGLRDAEFHKSRYDALIKSGDYSAIRYLVINFDQLPEVMFTSGYYPDASFAGERVQDLNDLKRTADLMTLSLITTEAAGAAVLAWLDPSPASERVAASLDGLPNEDIPHAIVRFAYTGENTFSSPPWWEALSNGARDALIRRTLDSANPFSPAHPDRYKDDGLRVVQWTAKDRLRK